MIHLRSQLGWKRLVRLDGLVRRAVWLGMVFSMLGCSGSKSRQREAAEVGARIHQLNMAEEQRKTTVWVRGQVRTPLVRWIPGMTLSQALVAAEYTSPRDPHVIQVSRGHEVVRIDPQRLLRRQDDLPLQPGDIIDIQ